MDSESRAEWLKKEVADWKNQGIIDENQAQAILSHYGPVEALSELEKSSKKEKNLSSVVSMLGSSLIVIGALLFVASSCDRIPDSLRLLLLFFTTFATYYLGWRLRFVTKTHPAVGHALLFLASVLVGATLFLTAQIFHVQADTHWVVLLWFLAISPLGYAFTSQPILRLTIFTLALWIIFYAFTAKEFYVGTFELFMVYVLFGISLYGFGQLHITTKAYAHFRPTYQSTGLFFILISYFYFSLRTFYEDILEEITVNDWVVQFLFILFGVMAFITVLVCNPKFKKFGFVKHEVSLLFLAFLGWICILVVTFIKDSFMTTTTQYGYTYVSIDSTVATILVIGFNALFFALCIESILVGYYKGFTSFVNVGMFFFVLGVLHVYFTEVYRFLPWSVAFILGGLVLLGMGWYLEKKRRSLIECMEAQPHR